jgi:hypothetical protein
MRGTPLRSRSCRNTNLLQDDTVDPIVLRHMMQPVSKSASDRSLIDHRAAPEMTMTTKKKPRLHASHSYRSLLQQTSNDSSQRNVYKKPPPFKKPARSGEGFDRDDYQQSPPPVHAEPGHSLWSPDSFALKNDRERQRRADVAIETQQQYQPGGHGGHGGCGSGSADYSLEYTHSMILQQEAILAEIKREELKQEAIRKKLLEDERAFSSSRHAAAYRSRENDLSAKLKREDLIMSGGNNDSSRRHVKNDISPAKIQKSSTDRTSKQQQQQESSASSSQSAPSSNAVQRLHGRRVKLFSESRVQDALERGDSVYLLRCIECDKQLLATKDLHNTFCSNCKSVFPTLMGKEVCSTRL